MATNSKIEWLSPLRADGTAIPGHTTNIWQGCEEIHDGCNVCYARKLTHRWGKELWGKDNPRMVTKSALEKLKNYQKDALALGEMHRVFVGSLMDICERPMNVVNWQGAKIYGDDGSQLTTGYYRKQFFEVVPQYPNLLFLMLSKRANYRRYIPSAWNNNPPTNVMYGTSISDPKTLKTLLPKIKAVNGYRFLSIEPQIALIDKIDLSGIDWVICGGESDVSKARPFHDEWAIALYEECKAQRVPFFFKQTGTWLAKKWGLQSAKGDDMKEWPEHLKIREFPHPSLFTVNPK